MIESTQAHAPMTAAVPESHAMTSLSEIAVDVLCEQFEEGWRPESAGPQSVAAFLENCRPRVPRDPEILCDLVEIDIERTWMAWAKQLEDIESAGSAAELLQARQAISGFAAYRPLFADAAGFDAVKSRLASCESRCREQWGDALGQYHYRELYGICIDANPDFQPRQVLCVMDQACRSDSQMFALRGLNTFGRRRSYDPADCFSQQTVTGSRIVIAEFALTSISREHFFVQLLTRDLAVVGHTCKVNPLRLLGHKPLVYKDNLVVRFPFSIRLPGRTLRFS